MFFLNILRIDNSKYSCDGRGKDITVLDLQPMHAAPREFVKGDSYGGRGKKIHYSGTVLGFAIGKCELSLIYHTGGTPGSYIPLLAI